MSDHQSQCDSLLAQLEEHLSKSRYNPSVVGQYLGAARDFLDYLGKRHVPIGDVQSSDVTTYLRFGLQQFIRRNGQAPSSVAHWRASRTGGIHQLLRLVNGHWPQRAASRSPEGVLSQTFCAEYMQWLIERRGMAPATISGHAAEARQFLSWYGERESIDAFPLIGIAGIDAYLQARAPSLRRVTRKTVAQRLQCFLRFAFATGRTEHDFAPSVLMPTLFALESIPSALKAEEIRAVLQTTAADPSPKGLRDYAILQLLATYGLRAGEITQLQLNDIDWRADRFCVRHTKSKAQSFLPLLPAVGDSLLAYLRRGRPTTEAREIFIRMHAPYRGFERGSCLYSLIRRRIEAAGVEPAGKRGPHTLRHARAVSLLRSGTPPKIIGDVLGHRSTVSTTPYLKLATEDLRGVALEVPSRIGEVQL